MNTNTYPRPLPEAITGTPWTVTFSGPVLNGDGRLCSGNTNTGQHQMMLPADTSADDGGRYVTLHELGHAKWTPAKATPHSSAKRCKCTVADIQFCEDFRINTLLHRSGLIPQDMRTGPAEGLTLNVSNLTGYSIAGRLYDVIEGLTYGRLKHLAARLDGPEHPMCLTGISHEYKAMVGLTRERLETNHDALALFDGAIAAADALTRDAVRTVYRRKSRRSPLPFKLTEKLARLIREGLDQYKGLEEPPLGGRPARTAGDGEWGKVKQLPPLPLAVAHQPKSAAAPVRRSALAGTRVGSIRRLLTDGRAFRRTVHPKVKGGTVLIDASGSMHISSADIRAILDAAPAATVAMYSGDTTIGTISIVAQRGRMATDDTINERRNEVGQGNIIDGPALDWLAKQAEPRIWICDGLVTGEHDRNTRNLQTDAAQKQRRANITRHESAERYLETVKGGA